MIKQFISPIQDWLLKHGQCVGCGMPLKQGKVDNTGEKIKLICKCGRIFIKTGDIYRRALFSEV